MATQELTEDGGVIVADGGEAEARIRRMSRRSFLQAAGVVALAGIGLHEFNKRASDSDSIKRPIRKVLNFDDWVAAGLLFSPTHLSHEFPRSLAVEPKNNYKGETPTVDLDTWRLNVDLADGKSKKLTLAEIQKLSKVDQTTELKCIEGWSVIVNWSGARFVDFAKLFPPPPGTTHVSFVSEPEKFPDERYYVGIDLASALHPQTLLAYEMNGKPLDADHGAPLRLVIPTKYGIKNIKLITGIAYSDKRPADYWFEQGYDYYAGL